MATTKKTTTKVTKSTKVVVKPKPQLIRPTKKTKFTLYDLYNQPRAYYLVNTININTQENKQETKQVTHSIIIMDRSGSMTYSMADMKDTLRKVLTLDEYANSDLHVTLISYASKGDVVCHFDHTPIKDIMEPNSAYQKIIAGLYTAGATCISQAVQLAVSKVRDGELTAITLHSDGYANDPSPSSEADKLIDIVSSINGKDAYVNTIAYTDYSDFRLLSRVANTGNGNSVKATSIKAVYEAIYNNIKSLSGKVCRTIDVSLPSDCCYQVFVSRSAKRIYGSDTTLSVVGLGENDDGVVYQFRKLKNETDYKGYGYDQCQNSEALLAYCRSSISEGSLNLAKYLMASTFDNTLLETHGRALTNNQIATWATDIDNVITNPDTFSEHDVRDSVPVNNKISVLELIDKLSEFGSEFEINREELQKVYVRRGLKRLIGTRDDNGNLIEPKIKTEYKSTDKYITPSSFDVNRNTATLNMLLTRNVYLVDEDGDSIDEVAGIELDNLKQFNYYTIIGDGELNVPYLKIRVKTQRMFTELKKLGFVTGRFTKSAEHTLNFSELPIVPPFKDSIDFSGLLDEMANLKVIQSICRAHLKEDSCEYTADQVEELKKHYLSKNLYLNFPTTNPYTDLQTALSDGSVDTRTSYRIDIGDRRMLNLGKLHSANKFLDRMYELVRPDGTTVEKPNFEMLLNGNMSFKRKDLSNGKTKLTTIDERMKPIFDTFLGIDVNSDVIDTLKSIGGQHLVGIINKRKDGTEPSRHAYVTALTKVLDGATEKLDWLFKTKLSNIVFYIGSTGVLPDEIAGTAYNAEKIVEECPGLVLSKEEKEGTFYIIDDDVVLSIYPTTEYFSRDK